MDVARRSLVLKAGGAALVALVCTGVFAAYLRPDMLVTAWNALLLCF